MNCIAVDDEPLALDIIEAYVNKHPELSLVARCNNAAEASEVLKTHKVDLMFLDINMPEISGLSFVKSLEKKPLFIFTTAYPDYAVEGFELNAIDYLLKPIAYDRFEKGVEKAKEYYKIKQNADVAETDLESDYIFVKANQKLIKLAYSDIYYVEAFADYVKIFLADKKIVTLQTMKNMEKKLPEDMFTRVHRSFIVNRKLVQSFSTSMCEVNDVKIPIGKNYKEVFVGLMKSNNIL
ncbi:LytTR family DNA-binding domain-containing protein [Bacteroidia bacterium]|jgi:DNA-binding LytR/AlgR family response regulator|nr:LytTR family DNA-binding domain-containing protein [Bacteroidia bacterium]MDC1430758.1 LytTR family DNA-binding domain-containing protein [Bacteroidia bacterium]|tara:strand:- start:84 stop:794 length:711 start_codon:yes stop_codon:yes gene_type:complete